MLAYSILRTAPAGTSERSTPSKEARNSRRKRKWRAREGQSVRRETLSDGGKMKKNTMH